MGNKIYYTLEEHKKFSENVLCDPPYNDDEAGLDPWLSDHEILISVAGKVISLPYCADNVSELERYLKNCYEAIDGDPTPANDKRVYHGDAAQLIRGYLLWLIEESLDSGATYIDDCYTSILATKYSDTKVFELMKNINKHSYKTQENVEAIWDMYKNHYAEYVSLINSIVKEQMRSRFEIAVDENVGFCGMSFLIYRGKNDLGECVETSHLVDDQFVECKDRVVSDHHKEVDTLAKTYRTVPSI